ncbi:MAG: DEAD/DEAH box helicase [Rhodospirillaceae bacterium]|jgi:ATP-dependent RNA helicase SUPV3L1/SUV3|nr:DEAD/DEAH box helicase [Rhodospirillaceae bacterium]
MQINSQNDTGEPRIIAVLGATNTGKTHFAMDRMLAHESGMIGFPLRLLARENYDRAVKIKGANQVALITGEEKIVPKGARYFLCTTEAMPTTRPVAFLGIDEIQMCADPDRGHVFTDRLLHARGRFETMFMGADTIKPLIRALVPQAEFVARPRLSTLSYVGPRKMARLPRRTAIVAFTASEVYAMAELIRRQRGGAAVIMGALSPRTRNAQVELYQSGEVDFLVATDAIGMGLNMDVDHVAFAQVRKFDGRQHRSLAASELAQVAGRAGRHMNDGTFGTTAALSAFDEEAVRRIEEHDFPPLEKVFWRNSRLEFRSLDTLQRSLAEVPDLPYLMRARPADDEISLRSLTANKDVAALASNPEAVRLLWEVCRIPDFRKVASDAHTRLLGEIYGHLRSDEGRLPTDWLAGQIDRLDRTGGDIETLTQRIAGIRIWTYVAFHADWVTDPAHWRERTREIEDKLSDVLHERLIQRFVDKRTAHLVRRLNEDRDLLGAVRADGEVLVEGHSVGRLSGFRFTADHGADGADGVAAARAVERAAAIALRQEIEHRVVSLVACADDQIAIADPRTAETPDLLWQSTPVARVVPGSELLRPQLYIFKSELLDGAQERRVRERLERWLRDHLHRMLAPLFIDTSALPSGAARGLHFRLTEHLGSMPRALVKAEIEALDKESRRALRATGIHIGRESVYAPVLLKSKPVALRGLLWALQNVMTLPLPLPADGRASIPTGREFPAAFLEAIGYRPLGPVAVRLEILERVAADAWDLSAKGPFEEPAPLMNLMGCGADGLAEVLKQLGYQSQKKGEQTIYRPKRREAGRTGKPRVPKGAKSAPNPKIDEDSPFAKLRELKIGGAGSA